MGLLRPWRAHELSELLHRSRLAAGRALHVVGFHDRLTVASRADRAAALTVLVSDVELHGISDVLKADLARG